jgi:hypothetical protein
MKIKCVKMQCLICGNSGSCQIFLNREGRISYARVRHYSHIDKESKKPQFTYCKLTDLDALKTLLLNKGISLSTDKAKLGQVGQRVRFESHDQQLGSLSFISKNKWAGSSARIEHHPPKVGVVGSNPTPPVLLISGLIAFSFNM